MKQLEYRVGVDLAKGEESDYTVEVLQKSDNKFGCIVANGILMCRCGECKQKDY